MAIKIIKNTINVTGQINIIIPAAGLGKRMKMHGPKSLIQLTNKYRVIDYQLKIIEKILPNSKIILVSGFESNVLMTNTPDNILKIENEKYEETNVVRSIGMALRLVNDNALIIYGDLIFNEECLKIIDYTKSNIIAGDIMSDEEIGCTIGENNLLENMIYDLPIKWGQIAFFKDKELKLLKQISWNPENFHLFGFEAINRIIDYGGKIFVSSSHRMKAIDIDTTKDIELARNII